MSSVFSFIVDRKFSHSVLSKKAVSQMRHKIESETFYLFLEKEKSLMTKYKNTRNFLCVKKKLS
jgi:hypothetical protein